MSLLIAAVLALQLGPTTTGQAVDQINSSSMRGVPSPPPTTAPRGDMIWAPERYVPIPGEPGGVRIPAHWQRVTPDGYVVSPPMTVIKPSTGTLETLPPSVSPLPRAGQSP